MTLRRSFLVKYLTDMHVCSQIYPCELSDCGLNFTVATRLLVGQVLSLPDLDEKTVITPGIKVILRRNMLKNSCFR